MRQRFLDPKTGNEVGEPMGVERGMRGFADKAPVAKKPVMKPGSRPFAHHPHDIVGARKKPNIPAKGLGEQPRQQPPPPDVAPAYDAEESPAHEAKESAAFEKKEHKKHDATPMPPPDMRPPGPGPNVGPLSPPDLKPPTTLKTRNAPPQEPPTVMPPRLGAPPKEPPTPLGRRGRGVAPPFKPGGGLV